MSGDRSNQCVVINQIPSPFLTNQIHLFPILSPLSILYSQLVNYLSPLPSSSLNQLGPLPIIIRSFPLPFQPDPRLWTREHVALWLQKAAVRFQLSKTYPNKFPMNGKALLLLTREMFLYRVPEGGGLLYEDIRYKMQKVFTEAVEQAAREAVSLDGVASKT